MVLAVAPLACGEDDSSQPIAVDIGDGGPADGSDGSSASAADSGARDSAGDMALPADTSAPDGSAAGAKMDAGVPDAPAKNDSGTPDGGDASVDLRLPSADGPVADGGACMPAVHPGTITFIDQATGQVRVENLANVPENLWWRTTPAGRIPVVTVISRITPGGRVEITLYGPCDQLLERTTS
jgi:hypothetical protein